MKLDREKILIALLIVIALIFVGYRYVYNPLVEHKERLDDQMASLGNYNVNVENMQSQEASVSQTLQELNSKIDNLKNEEGNQIINTQDFLLFLSTKTKEADVYIQKFKDLGVTEENGVWRVRFDVELNGYMKDLIRITQNIDDLGVSYDIKSVSLRQEGDIEYLSRAHKEQVDLVWFNYEKEEEVYTNEIPIEVPTNEIPIDVPTVEETPPQTTVEVIEVPPETLEEQLEILLGIAKPKTITKKTTVPGSTNNNNSNKKVVEESKEETKANSKSFKETRMNLDFTIEFIMFNDPRTVLNYRDLYEGDNHIGSQEFVIDAEGNKLTIDEINVRIKEDSEFVNREIDRVMGIVTEENTGEFADDIKEYLNYLLGKR